MAHSASSVGGPLDQWLEHIEAEGRSPTTLRGYQSIINQLQVRRHRKGL